MATSDIATWATVILMAVAAGLWLRSLTRSVGRVDKHVVVVRDAVSSLRRAHEDHVERLNRRLLDIETAAAGAQTEGRLVSAQLADHQAQLSENIQTQIEPQPPANGPEAGT